MLKRWGVEKAEDIHVEAMARAEGITVVEGPLRGARGRLAAGPRPVIRIAEDTILEGARRFTVAHELAHHVLKHPASFSGACSSHTQSKVRDTSNRDYEAEANAFGTELLMPRHLVTPRVTSGTPSLEIPRAIALEFSTSIPASAIRYVQLTKDRCAAVYSERGTIRWASRSHRFAASLARDVPLSRKSYAYECAGTQDLDDRARAIQAGVWLETNAAVEIVEHSAPVSEVGGVITLLWVPEKSASALWLVQS
jgi:Zn-dependent peptidase ImmA (M78 family)